MKESWWIDVVEGEFFESEIDKEEFDNVEVLPQTVIEKSKVFKEMSALRDFIKYELDTVISEDGHYYQDLQNKIMTNIRQYECEKQQSHIKREESDSQSLAKFQNAKLYFSLGL